MQKIGLRGRALAEGRNVLIAKHLRQTSAQFLGNVGRIQLWTRRLGLRRREVYCKKSDIFSATKVIAAGFKPQKQVPDLGAAGPVDRELLAAGRLLCQPSPNRAPNERKLYPCVATIALV